MLIHSKGLIFFHVISKIMLMWDFSTAKGRRDFVVDKRDLIGTSLFTFIVQIIYKSESFAKALCLLPEAPEITSKFCYNKGLGEFF